MKKRMLALALALVLSLSAVLMTACKHEEADPLLGSWKLDVTTTYVFEEEGKGSMNLPLSRNPFTYTVEENRISIDFEDPGLTDRTYVFSIEGNTLTMTVQAVGAAEEVTYIFTRIVK